MYLQAHITHKSGAMKTVCTSAVLDHFGVSPDQYHYSSCSDDIKRILRRFGYSVRSRKSAVGYKPGKMSIGQLRKALKKTDGSKHTRYYVGVRGHAMVLSGDGRTVVDTDPRKRDMRIVNHVSIVERKSGEQDIRIGDLTMAQVEIAARILKAGGKPTAADLGIAA